MITLKIIHKLKVSMVVATAVCFCFAAKVASAEYYVVYAAQPVVVVEKTRYVKRTHHYKRPTCSRPHYKHKHVYARPRSSYHVSVTYVWRTFPECGCGVWMPERWYQAPYPYYYDEYQKSAYPYSGGYSYREREYTRTTPVRDHRNYSSSYYYNSDQDMATGDDNVMDEPGMDSQY